MVDHSPTDDTVLRQQAAPISPQEIAEMRAHNKAVLDMTTFPAKGPGMAVVNLRSEFRKIGRLLDAIEALTAERDRLRDALNTTALEACEAIDDRLQPEIERLTAENARLTSENSDIRAMIADPQAVHLGMLRGGIAKPSLRNMLHLNGGNALRIWDEAVETRIELAGVTAERDALKAEVDCMCEMIVRWSDREGISPEARLGVLRNMPTVADWEKAHAHEADHAAAVQAKRQAERAKDDDALSAFAMRDLVDAAGIDMGLLGKLCREEPDEDTKREVAEMMAGISESPLSHPDYPALMAEALRQAKDGD